MLWHLTARYTPRGDVGKWSDDEIAMALDWEGDPAALIYAFIQSGLLENHPEHRLVVHDWADHAENTVRKCIKRKGLSFVSKHVGTSPDMSRQVAPALCPLPKPFALCPLPDLSLATLARTPANEFDEFWKAYPVHEGKQRARKAWAKLKPPPLRAILEALEWQRRLPKWAEDGGRYVPHAATYLNGRRWEDERPPDPVDALVARLEAKGLV